jgi:hypothetical protein
MSRKSHNAELGGRLGLGMALADDPADPTLTKLVYVVQDLMRDQQAHRMSAQGHDDLAAAMDLLEGGTRAPIHKEIDSTAVLHSAEEVLQASISEGYTDIEERARDVIAAYQEIIKKEEKRRHRWTRR